MGGPFTENIKRRVVAGRGGGGRRVIRRRLERLSLPPFSCAYYVSVRRCFMFCLGRLVLP